MITDNEIINIFYSKRGFINPNRTQKQWLNKNRDIYDYLINRYTDSDSIHETLYRIKNNIEQKPKCKNCGKILLFNGKKFCNFCSSKCAIKYGVTTTEQALQKSKQTKLERYGDKNYVNIEKSKQTKLERYGDKNYVNIEKIKQTCLERYGVNNPYQIKEVLEKAKINSAKNAWKRPLTYFKHTGYTNPLSNPEVKIKIDWESKKQKEYNTKLKNKSFNKSIPEEECYKILSTKFKYIERQKFDKNKYPYKCDFYIKDIDTWIEFNGSQFHQGHPYNSNNKNDIEQLKKLQEKSHQYYIKYKHKSQYDKMIYVWTNLDVRKRNIAKQNNLNFIELWNLDDVEQFIKQF